MVPRKKNPQKSGHRKTGPRKKSPRKNCGVNVEDCGVCGMLECDQSIKEKNSETKNRRVSVERRGVRLECWDEINL